ncbi:hypothetical protein IAU60_004408 [Kwoniella sp. DSM 27419]
MAAALHMQPQAHRPSMDRAPSFDQPRARSTPPFASPYDSPSLAPPVTHVRSNSNSSNSSPYSQPFPHSYFPQHQMYAGQPQSWTSTAVPAAAFYTPPFHGFPNGHQHQPVFHQFQQSQADFAAWANAYQHMVMSSVQNGGHPGGMPPTGAFDHSGHGHDGRRMGSGSGQPNHFQPGQSQPIDISTPPASAKAQPQLPQGYHPYKRGPSAKSSREQLPRSTSMSSEMNQQSPSQAQAQLQRPASQTDTTVPDSISKDQRLGNAMTPPPRLGAHSRTQSSSSERSLSRVTTAPPPAPIAVTAPAVVGVSASSSNPVSSAARTSTPLQTGAITNATNTPRPSPLSQPVSTPEPTDKMVKTGGLKGRLRKALDKDIKKDQKSAPAVPVKQSLAPRHFASPSVSSTQSATPPVTPPQDLPAPSRPFATNPAAMSSDVSLAETQRTATLAEEPKEKGKRSLFRMKNMSTDNISLASTVSSASMMIRKMGSIGKLARRNSLMGISRIFKDKPKDEDAALPEKEAKKKKDKKKKGKGEAAPATVSHALAEPDRLTGDDDRTLAGLTPAAKLARQHTLKSRAEQVKQDVEPTGEPTWDNNTTTRNGQQAAVAGMPNGHSKPEVVRVHPSQAPTVVHAVAVTEQEYDSEDDSSDGETVEDITINLGRTKLSDEADAEFQATWGNTWIDKNAVPKKGILKNTSSFSSVDGEATGNRQRSDSHHASFSAAPGPLSQLPASNPAQLDGLAHPSPRVDPAYDPFSPHFSPFDQPAPIQDGLYANAAHNTSAPTLSLPGQGTVKPLQTRSMTVPARRRINWAPECAVYSTYDPGTYDRRSEPATCNRLTPELAMLIKQELNAFKLEMPVHPASKDNTHYFAW